MSHGSPAAEPHVPSRVHALVLTLLLVGGMLTADHVGVTRRLNLLPYDLFCRLDASNPVGETQVLLIEAEDKALQDERIVRELVLKLQELRAEAVGTTFPCEFAERLRMQCADIPRLVIGRVGAEMNGDDESRFGSIDLLSPADGVYRRHFTIRDSQPSIESQLWRHSTKAKNHKLPTADYLVHFRGGSDSLFHVPASSVLRDEMTVDLVAGKVALIGRQMTPGQPGLVCPTTQEMPMTPLEFHGHALNTLLADHVVQEVPWWACGLIYLVTGTLAQLVSRRVDMHVATAVMLAWLTGLGLICWCLFHWGHLWLPFLSVGLLQAVCLFCVHSNRYLYLRSALAVMFERQQLRNRRHRFSTDFLSSDDVWGDLADLLHQMFHFDRIVLMELPEGRVHLQVTRLVHCLEEEVILERRRDVRRTPYSNAVETKKIVEVSKNRPFFSDTAEEKLQFLCPLMVGGLVLGFIAVETCASTIESRNDFDAKMQRLCDEFAALLAHRRRLDRAVAMRRHWTRRCVEISEETILEGLRQNERLTNLREAHYGSAFDTSHSACAIADAIGQVISTNSSMANVLREEGVAVSDLSVVELISTLGQQNHHEARKILRNVVFKEEKQSMLVKRNVDSPCLLEIQAIRSSSSDGTGAQHEPFSICGFRVELILGEEFADLRQAQDELKSQAFQAISQSLRNIKRRVHTLDQGEAISREIELDLRHAMSTLREYRSFQSQSISGRAEDVFPINVNRVLEQATNSLKIHVESRGIEIVGPELSADVTVVANPQFIDQVFTRVLGFMIEGASDESEVIIDFEDAGSSVQFRFRNSGFGTPMNEIRQVLSDGVPSNLDDFNQLREVQAWIQQWGGWMSVTSELGEGTELKLVMQRHSWSLGYELPTDPSAKLQQSAEVSSGDS